MQDSRTVINTGNEFHVDIVDEAKHLINFTIYLKELTKSHLLDLEIEVNILKPINETESKVIPHICVMSANSMHISVFKALGLTTGLFTMERMISLDSTRWAYDLTPTA